MESNTNEKGMVAVVDEMAYIALESTGEVTPKIGEPFVPKVSIDGGDNRVYTMEELEAKMTPEELEVHKVNLDNYKSAMENGAEYNPTESLAAMKTRIEMEHSYGVVRSKGVVKAKLTSTQAVKKKKKAKAAKKSKQKNRGKK